MPCVKVRSIVDLPEGEEVGVSQLKEISEDAQCLRRNRGRRAPLPREARIPALFTASNLPMRKRHDVTYHCRLR